MSYDLTVGPEVLGQTGYAVEAVVVPVVPEASSRMEEGVEGREETTVVQKKEFTHSGGRGMGRGARVEFGVRQGWGVVVRVGNEEECELGWGGIRVGV